MRKEVMIAYGIVTGVLFFLGLLSQGCSVFSVKAEWCKSIPEGESVICAVAHRAGAEPEEVAAAFKVENVAGLSMSLYTARQAMAFFDNLEAEAMRARDLGTITYEDMVLYALNLYGQMPPSVQALIIISEDFYRLDIPDIRIRPLTRYDWDGILSHIQDQRRIIFPFLVVDQY